MDPVTSPLIHKDSGHQARVDPGEENPSNLQEQASSRRLSRNQLMSSGATRLSTIDRNKSV